MRKTRTTAHAKTQRWIHSEGAARDVALEVLRRGPMSRSEIARKLSLSAASLTRLSTPLIKTGLLVEVGEQSDGRVGRPSQLIDVASDSQHFVGIKLTAKSILGVTTNLRGKVLASASAKLVLREPDAVVALISGLVREFLIGVPSVTAIGIGIGGKVARDGLVLSAPFLDWSDVPLRELVEKETGLPTVVENDVIAFTEFEHWFGAGHKLSTFAVITLGAGVGYGLVANDHIVTNVDHGIGLVGHWPLDPFGPVCLEGHRGCAKSILTDDAIASTVSSALGRPVSYNEALDLALADEPAARRVVDDAGRGLGRLLAAIANIVMPELIVLGGEGVRLADVASEQVEEGMRLDRDPRATPIHLVHRSGEHVEWCRGAAVTAIQSFVLGDEIGVNIVS